MDANNKILPDRWWFRTIIIAIGIVCITDGIRNAYLWIDVEHMSLERWYVETECSFLPAAFGLLIGICFALIGVFRKFGKVKFGFLLVAIVLGLLWNFILPLLWLIHSALT